MSFLARICSSAVLRAQCTHSPFMSPWSAVSASSSTLSPASALVQVLQQQPQTRSIWQEVLRSTRDPKDPSKVKFEDAEVMANRSGRAQGAEGLLRRRPIYHEKAWMKRKRLKEGKAFRRKKQIVDQLTTFIKFQQEYRNKRKGE
mmetsp:Transcript_20227/g.58499  ORF Transcript_20227/g.58499 Transcript_20227/m.58499 type:complete len:145 (-) Transcript_20227:721-1155(-)|eukprot:CAMPEP_0113548062 /NCGR_PEP_ID=MMETSP0015_2-20120614/12693_1 /TAXON_ID=2838 /ORGANISM="Odontella" /LENGTH=144 /DNA_ID=CAMNT_0000448667 /DNA_START=73 /DNA_END=507 /DNA_ORIENTATION=+ /assembly_acc=CAM_ASM_000160